MTFQKHNVLQRIMLCFSKTSVFTMNYTPCGWEPFWDLFGTGRGQWQSRAEPSRAGTGRAEPSRAEPSRAEPSRAEPSRAGPGRAEPGRAEPGRAEPGDPKAIQKHRPGDPSVAQKVLVCWLHHIIFGTMPHIYYIYIYILSRLRRKVLMAQRPTLLWAIRTNMTAGPFGSGHFGSDHFGSSHFC